MSEKFDVTVIGGGPGGYVCAIRLSQLGLKTACIESRGSLGGTCLNIGCIPSKSLLNLSEKFHSAKNFEKIGIETGEIKLNLDKMMKNKDKAVTVLTKGVEFLFKKNKVTYFKGKGSFENENSIKIEGLEGTKIIQTDKTIISTGSEPVSLPGVDFDEERILSSTGALSIPKLPNKMIVVGGGYIGLEMGSVWSRLGTEVTVVEFLDHITPGMDRDISNEFMKILKKQGIKFNLNTKVDKITKNSNGVTVETSQNDGQKVKHDVDVVLISVGYIGLEMGSVWSRLGTEVTVVEFLDHITPGMDRDISNEFMKILKKQGIKFNLNTKVDKITKNSNGVTVETSQNDGQKVKHDVDVVLISVGRRPYTKNLNLDKVGVKLDEKGRVKVNKNFETNVKNIYAIGDVIDGPMLAHKAEEEGIAVAELIAGQSGHVNYDIIPGVVYTSPEVAYVGKSEEQLKKENIGYKIGKFPFMANSRAKAIDEPEGFVKILADQSTDKVLGVHIIGPHAGEMIAEMAVAMEFGASSEDIARTCHAHPTFSEAIKEAALSVDKRQIHS